MTTNTRVQKKQLKSVLRVVVNIRGRSGRNKKVKDEAEEGRDNPDFRSVWSADAWAHSSTLQSRGAQKRREGI